MKNGIRKTNTGEWAAIKVETKDGTQQARVALIGNKRDAIKAAGTNTVIA